METFLVNRNDLSRSRSSGLRMPILGLTVLAVKKFFFKTEADQPSDSVLGDLDHETENKRQ